MLADVWHSDTFPQNIGSSVFDTFPLISSQDGRSRCMAPSPTSLKAQLLICFYFLTGWQEQRSHRAQRARAASCHAQRPHICRHDAKHHEGPPAARHRHTSRRSHRESSLECVYGQFAVKVDLKGFNGAQGQFAVKISLMGVVKHEGPLD